MLAIGLSGCDNAPDVTVEETPIKIVEQAPGRGPDAGEGDLVTIGYRITTTDGTLILSDDRYSFQIGQGTVIAGVDETVRGMRVGGRRLVKCPPQRHWGREGYGNGKIPPNTPLMMDIRLKSVD